MKVAVSNNNKEETTRKLCRKTWTKAKKGAKVGRILNRLTGYGRVR